MFLATENIKATIRKQISNLRICEGVEYMLWFMTRQQKALSDLLSFFPSKGMKQFKFQIIVYGMSNNFTTFNVPLTYSGMITEK